MRVADYYSTTLIPFKQGSLTSRHFYKKKQRACAVRDKQDPVSCLDEAGWLVSRLRKWREKTRDLCLSQPCLIIVCRNCLSQETLLMIGRSLQLMCHLNEFPAGEETGHEDIHRIAATGDDKRFSLHVSGERELRDG